MITNILILYGISCIAVFTALMVENGWGRSKNERGDVPRVVFIACGALCSLAWPAIAFILILLHGEF